MTLDSTEDHLNQKGGENLTEFPKTFGWIGLGAMGFPMALQLVKRSPPGTKLYIYDVNASAMDAFVETVTSIAGFGGEGSEGAVEVVKMRCAREVTEHSECIITIVPEGSHVRSVFLTSETGILAASDISGKIFIDCSTIDIETSKLINQSIMSAHSRYISQLQHHTTGSSTTIRPPSFFDAPVSGGTAGASAGTLSILLGIPPTSPALPHLTAILHAAGGRTVHAMGGPTLGLAAKLANNYLSGLIALATSEAMNLGMRLGIEPRALQRCFGTSSGASWVNDTVNPVPGVCPDAVTSRGYEGGFKVQLMKKDMGLAIAAAKEVGANLVLADAGLAAYSAAADDPRCRDRDSRVIYRWIGGVEPEAVTGERTVVEKE